MIRMSKPATTDIIGEMWATVRVIEISPGDVGKTRIEAEILSAVAVPE
jgi:hypothetical protein